MIRVQFYTDFFGTFGRFDSLIGWSFCLLDDSKSIRPSSLTKVLIEALGLTLIDLPNILCGCGGFDCVWDIRYGTSILSVSVNNFLSISGRSGSAPSYWLGNKGGPIFFVEANTDIIGVNSACGFYVSFNYAKFIFPWGVVYTSM